MSVAGEVRDFVHAFEPGDDSRGDALLLLHGTGGDEQSLMKLGEMLAPGAARLAPRGKVLEGAMPRFFRRLREGVFDEEDVLVRATELARWIERATRHYGLAPEQTTVVGYSNGANIAAAMMLLTPGVITRAILLRPMMPLQQVATPDLRGVSALLCVGRHDPITPAASAERLGGTFRAGGAAVTLELDEGDHALPREAIAASRAWLLAAQG